MHPDSKKAKQFRKKYPKEIEIYFIGVWDTVEALGIPIKGLRWFTKRKYRLHDVELSKIVKHGYQTIAIDEKRKTFTPALWEDKM